MDQTVTINVSQASPAFSGLTASQAISYGTSTITVSGTLSAPTATPAGQQVSVSVGGASATATVQGDATFTATIDTHAIGAATTPYAITYSYTGDTNFKSASDSSTTLTVNKATTTIAWNNPSGIVYGTALSATQLNATAANPNNGASVAGTFTYTPAAGAVLARATRRSRSTSSRTTRPTTPRRWTRPSRSTSRRRARRSAA